MHILTKSMSYVIVLCHGLLWLICIQCLGGLTLFCFLMHHLKNTAIGFCMVDLCFKQCHEMIFSLDEMQRHLCFFSIYEKETSSSR